MECEIEDFEIEKEIEFEDFKLEKGLELEDFEIDAEKIVTNNYPDLNNLPQVNNVTLVDNKSFEDLGLLEVENTELKEMFDRIFN